ncbi:hypothetical protein SAMN05421805_101966 [Saccharopolyspora antimicrobica]|uniref:DUF4149 domain-containing protein n=1 Tax=Saccharopolyspora antimicrobica TaxID=455193 RepID=A0A1I4SEW4_9PSEU|nr:hypothetical protein [Saccharopolyspora antimicrobica]RKT87716.1 hypothetical protein ATL45_6136 [Saccharopolyspora antimicrobica]SFM63019.1 hypothetical protein SAMN05421805_101966 [Saccharopolyspora antimicrobica]
MSNPVPTALAVAGAASWLWLGMVLAISFLEAPLKFRAPGVDLRTGLAIGRLVFRALNTAEVVLALVIALSLATAQPGGTPVAAGAAAIVLLALQLVAVRPRLSRRTAAVLAGEGGPRAKAHLWYVALELLKVIALLLLGIAVLL